MTAPAPLKEALQLKPCDQAGVYSCSLLPEWRHGPGIYGGLQAALLLDAMGLVADDPTRAPRSLTAQFLSPATPGPATCTIEVLRRGRSMTSLVGTLHRGSEIFARASGTFALPRASRHYDRHPSAPSVPTWEALSDSQHGDNPPTFLSLLQFRDCLGASPYSGADKAHLGGWGRFVHPTLLTPATITALIDAWPPAVLACYPHMERAASVELSLAFHPSALTPNPPLDVPALYEAHSEAIGDGFSEEHATLWSDSGALLATVTQRVIVFD